MGVKEVRTFFSTGSLVEDFLKDIEVDQDSSQAILIPFLPGNHVAAFPTLRITERTDQDPIVELLIFLLGVVWEEGVVVIPHQLNGIHFFELFF